MLFCSGLAVIIYRWCFEVHISYPPQLLWRCLSEGVPFIPPGPGVYGFCTQTLLTDIKLNLLVVCWYIRRTWEPYIIRGVKFSQVAFVTPDILACQTQVYTLPLITAAINLDVPLFRPPQRHIIHVISSTCAFSAVTYLLWKKGVLLCLVMCRISLEGEYNTNI